MDTQVAERLRTFISDSFLFGDDTRMPTDTDSLLETGILDSTGVLELIEFLEETFEISIADHETIPENLGSIGGLIRFVTDKQG